MSASILFMDEGSNVVFSKIAHGIGLKYNGKGLSIKTGEILPNDHVPVTALENGKPSLFLMKWGFPVKGSTELVVNARSETASQKRMFASPLARRRCVIPSTGFLVWLKPEGKPKNKIILSVSGSSMFYIAGIYSEHQKHGDDEPIANRFVVLTQPASTVIDSNLKRIPVMLYKNEICRWLTDQSFANTIMNRKTIQLNRIVA